MIRPAAAAFAAVMLLAVPAVAMAPAASDEEAPDKAKMPDYDRAMALIDEERFAEAVPLLQAVVKRSPKHADAWSQLGFAERKSGNWKDGEAYYAKALAIDPNHQEALEYLGELYLETGREKEAAALLAKLVKLCPDGCEARSELEEAIEAHRRRKKK